MNRQMPYVISDTDGTPVTPAQANAIILEHWTVPAEVRSRRRSHKGKAPQAVSTRRRQRGDLPHHPSSDPPSSTVNRRNDPQRLIA